MGMWRSLHPSNSADSSQKRRREGGRRKNTARRSPDIKALKRRALIERFEQREMLSGSPMLISIVANSGDVVYSPNLGAQAAVLHTAPHELDLTFKQGTVIDPTTLGGIQVVAAGNDGKLDTADDVAVKPGYVGIGSTPNEVVLRFDQTLSDGQYQITLLGSGPNALADSNSPPDDFSSGVAGSPNLQVDFAVDAGPQVVSVVPEPIVYNSTTNQLQQNTSEIDVYFSKPIQTLATGVNQIDPRLFQLIVTGDTANTSNQGYVNPQSVSFDPTTNKATLLFRASLDTFGTGAMRLRIGNDEQIVNNVSGQPPTAASQPLSSAIPEPGSTFGDSAQPSLAPAVVNLENTAQMQHQVISTVLGATSVNPGLNIPGGNSGVGVRNDPVEQHIDYSESPLGLPAFAAKPTPGTIPTYTYNFPNQYAGAASSLTNVITDAQRNLARQIFQLWGNYLGVQFKEVGSETLGAADFGVVTGQVQAVNATVSANLNAIAGPAPNSPKTVNGVPEYLAVMNAQTYSGESLYGGPWFTAAMQQVGRLLGLGYDIEGPPGTVMGSGGADPATGAAPEPVFPGNADILHGQSIYTPQSDNVDVYQFTLHSAGQFSAETIAQRGLFNVITVPSATANGQVGTGVVDGSTFTLSDGTQTLTFEFAANGRAAAAGHFAIAYNTTDTPQTVAVDIAKAINTAASASGLNVFSGAYGNQVQLSGSVTVTPLNASFNVITVPSTSGSVGTGVIDGSTFTISDGTHSVTFEFAANGRTVTDGNTPIAFNSTDTAATVAGDIASAINKASASTGLNALASAVQGQVEITGPDTVTAAAAYLNSITIPSSGGSVGTGVVDGSTFTVSNGTQSITFEFAANGRVVTDGNSPIAYNTTDSAAVVANDVANAVSAAATTAGMQLVATAQADVVDISGPITVTPSGSQGQVTYAQQTGQVTYGQSSNQLVYSQQPSQLNSVLTLYSQSNVIQVPENASSPGSPVGTSVVDGSTFTINDGVHPAVTFEFIAKPRTESANDTNVPIYFDPLNDSAHAVAVEIANAINSAASKTGLDVTATVQFDQVVLNGPVTVAESAGQGGVTYTVSRQIISRNDDYYGNDSFLNMQLAPGTYYLAVSSTGNTQFNPAVPGSGSGGTTQGPYQLKLDFTRAASGTLTDLDGNPLVGNSNGTTGGAYNFWFEPAVPAAGTATAPNVGNTIFVDKTPPGGTTTVQQVDGSGHLVATAQVYTNVSQALQVAADRLIAPGGSTPNLDGQTFVVADGTNNPVTFEFAADNRQVTALPNGQVPVAVNFNSGNAGGTPDTPSQVAQKIVNTIVDQVNLGVLAGSVKPTATGNVVDVTGAASVDASGSAALMASSKVVRILGSAGPDNSIGVPLSTSVANSPSQGNIFVSSNSKPTFKITSGSLTATFEFTNSSSGVTAGKLADGNYAVVVPVGAQAQAIATAMAAAINASPLSTAAGGAVVAKVSMNAMAYTGPVAWWISLTAASPVVINAQGVVDSTGSAVLSTVSTANAYQIGASPINNTTLADGRTMDVPQDTTVMIDAGAIFKLDGANINVGLNVPGVNDVQSALQVLGTPNSSVYFTSFNDNSVGSVTNAVTAVSPGDWGGINYGPAADLESEGVFLDSVNHARISYAGGSVLVGGQEAAYTPIYIAGSRPAITNNTIIQSRDSAVSADPNSFAETVFGSPATVPGNLPSPIQSPPTAAISGGTLANGTYYYLVTAIGPAGETAGLASDVEMVGGVPTLVTRPTNETSVAVTGPNGAVTVNWYAVPGATGYKIYRGTNSGQENVLVGVVNSGITSFVDNGSVVATGQSPPTQQAFVTDYERAGPDISGNTLAVTQPGATTITASVGNQILAGETFVVTNPNTGVSSVFEFVNDVANLGTVAGAVLPDGNFAVPFSPGIPASGTIKAVPPDTAAQVAANIAAAINAAAIKGVPIGVTASAAANSAQVSVVGASNVVASTPSSLIAPAGSQVTNGETFVVTNLATGAQATFEFNTGAAAAGHIGITITKQDTPTTVASEMAAAINSSGIGVSAVTASFTLAGTTVYEVVLSGATSFQFTNVQGTGVNAVSSNTLSLAPGNALTDGSTFVINSPTTGASLTFQYILNTDTTPVPSGNIPITYTTADPNAKVAAETAAAINASGIAAYAAVTGNQVSLLASTTGYFASPLTISSNVVANTLNGLFVRTQDSVSQAAQSLTVSAVWTATDMPYVLSDNLILQGNPGGALDSSARLGARLDIVPGVTVKLNSARIETDMGANLIAEGTASQPIVFTSLRDNSYGGGGTFATDGVTSSTTASANLATPGDWAGLYFAPTSRGSLDSTVVAFGGGKSTVNGNSDSFDAVEIHQASVRIADSTIESNAGGIATGSRGDLEGNDSATIYVLGAQPAIVNNVFENNSAATISINANSLTSAIVPDWGRSTGPISRFTQFDTNDGPLVRLNKIGNSLSHTAINGMLVRPGTLDTQSVWDDTDIVHVVEGSIVVPNIDTQGGLTLDSSTSASLVVKLSGQNAGFTATGTPLDVTNRVGGSVHLIGTPTHPVVLTALTDTTVGAGTTPDGRPQYDTNNTGIGGSVQASGIPTFPPSGKQLAVTTTQTATSLVNAMLLRPLATGVTITGSSLMSANANQQGTYANGDGVPLQIPQKGTILTSGDARLPVQNTSPAWTGAWNGPGDPRLSALIGGTQTFDANELTINFTVAPNSGIKSGAFEFQFGSEEYPQFVGSPFNDVLAGFINGNQATNFMHDSKGNLVSINSALFNLDNSVNAGTGKSPYNIEYNGLTSGLVATFPVQPGANTLTIAIADASDDVLDSGVLMTDLHFSSQPVGAGGVSAGGASSGAWQGVTLDQYSNDNNVAVVNEAEPAYTGGVDANGTPSTAQPLGQLAPNLTSGDDNQRLGFVVNGTISPNAPSDADVYSFQAKPGTHVWMSLGNTSPGLDAVLELVDANGTVLARSNSAVNEAANPSLLSTAPPTGIGFAGNLAQPFSSSPLLGGNYDPSNPSLSDTLYNPLSLTNPGQQDLQATSALDPGFQVVLPVPAGGSTTGTDQYFVRVRSLGTNINDVHGGQSSGAYQLSVNLQQAPLPPGSSVQYADIRYATNGITVQGLPAHSPLTATSGQATNPPSTTDASQANQPNPLPTAQNLGNLLATDQNNISVSGSLTPSANNPNLSTQVDWYTFSVNYNLVQLLQGSVASDKTFAAMFDVDYADGLQRANTTISVYNSAGQLIYFGQNSNVADDQAIPGAANGLSELTNGSMGQNDPFIGSVQLPAGEQGGTSETYYVAISSSAALPTAIDGTFSAGSTNALVRLEPIDSLNRVAEDHVGSQGGETAQPASSLTPLFNGSVDTSATNFIPTAPIIATPQQTQQIQSLNTSAVPFTLGNVVLFVSQSPYTNASGVLQTGHLQTVNPFTGALETDIGALPGSGNGFDGIGMRNDGQLYGLTLGNTDLAAGQYDQISTGTATTAQAGADGIRTFTNSPNAGIVPQNIGVQIHALAYVQNGTNRQLFVVASYAGDPFTPGSAFTNGLYQLDPNTGAVINPRPNPGGGANPLPGAVLQPVGVSPPETITGLASIGNQLYAITDKGGLYLVNDPSGSASLQFIGAIKDATGHAVGFTSLTAGPPDVANGAFANDLFGIDATGRLYVFNTAGVLQNVLAGGASSVALGTTHVTGMAFSTLDYNLWHVTDARATDAGHGVNTAPDNSRNANSANQPSAGNLSYYFGMENPATGAGVIDTATGVSLQPGAANYATNVNAAGANNVYGTYNLPGGATGSLQTNSFSLANYNAGDLPTLYFNYYLDSGMTQNSTSGWKSSARVMVSADGGNTWSELATNDPSRVAYSASADPRTSSLATRQNSQSSELPGFASQFGSTPATTVNGVAVTDPRQQVQQLFDSTGQWRQAVVDLSNYAGQGNIMLRFDFSSAGAMGPANSGLPGDKFGNYNNAVRGQNNQHEGFYVDDVTVGFADRGEMVTNAAANTQYFTVPQTPNTNAPTQNLGGSGPYQLDIRAGTEYATTVSNSLPDISLVNSFDTNDRLSNSFSILAPAGAALTDGATFQISDGNEHTVTFQFHLSTDTTSVPPGNVAVPYLPTSTAAQVAANIAAAVNANTTLTGVTATTIQNTINGATVVTGNRVNLFGVTKLSSPQSLIGTLTTSVANHMLVEGNQATTTVTISRSGSSANPVSVTVSAFDVGGGASANVQFIDPTTQAPLGSSTTVLIPAGQTSATVTVQERDQTIGATNAELADGPRKVQIVATANNYGSNADTLDVVDNPSTVPTLTLTVSQPSNAIISENAGANAAQLTLTRNTPTNVPLVVMLTSLDPASATVPTTVTIPAGSASTTVSVTAVDDNVLRTQPVNVTFVASAVNFAPGTTSITVNDDNDSDPPLGTAVWQSAGPTTITGGRVTNITDLSGNLTNPVDGPIEAVLAPPASANQPNTLYIGAVNGGVWKTTNANAPGGPTWVPLTDNTKATDSLSIADLQFGTTNGQFDYNKLIAGVGHTSDFANEGGNLVGVMTSNDGGASWTVLAPGNSSTVTPVGQNITSVAWRDNIIMAGTAANSNTVGLLRSTDGGQTFVLVSTQANSGLPVGPISDLVGDPIDPKRYYAAVLGQGIFTSDDDGATWLNVTPTALTSILNSNPSGDDIRIADNGSAVYFGYEKFNSATGRTDLALIERSPTTGLSATTWTAMDLPTTNINGTFYGLNPEGGSDSNAPGGQKIIHFSIVADPNSANIVYVGGDSQTVFPNAVGSVALTGRLFRGNASLPSGSQWTPITDNFTGNHSAPHSDSRNLTFLGSSLVEVDDGGIYSLSNPTTSTGVWTSLIGNLDVTEIHDVAYDTNTNTVIAGTQDTGTAQQQSSTSTVWSQVNQLNGGAVAVDNSTPGTSIRYTSSSYLGGGPGGFQAGTYDSNGNLLSTTSPALVVNGTGGRNIYQTDPSLPYVTTVVLNALNPKQMLIGGENAVYESLDGGQTLTSLGVGGAGANSLEGAAMAYGGSLSGVPYAGVLWIGIGKQVYMRSSQGGAVVATQYSTTAGVGNVRALAMDPNNWQTAAIVDDAGNVWLTTNSGQSFTNITGNLLSANGSAINLFSVAIVPSQTTNLIYVGAQDGVYQMQTINSGVWTRYGASLPGVPVLSLEYVAGQQQYLPADQQQQLLVAGTLGRGAYLISSIGAGGDLTITLNQQTVSDDYNAITGTGVISGTVSRSGTFGDLPVVIQSSDPAVVPPTSVVIPNGQESVNFTINVNDLQDAGGNEVAVPRQTVILSPQAAGTNSIGTFVNVSDDGQPLPDDSPALSVTLPVNRMNPSLGSMTIVGTVSRNTPTDQPLLVTLVSSDPSRGSVLQANGTNTVVIPAGQTSATFTLTAVDQFVSDGQPQWVSVTAFAVNYQGLGIASANADGNDDQPFSVEISPTQHLITYNHQGDSNVVPLQGQVIILDNRISNSLDYGVVVQAAPSDAGGSTPYPGVPMNFQPLNTDRVIPGTTITNNLLVGNGQGGVNLVGNSNSGNVPLAAVPIARVLNNTIYGASTPTGIGVNVGVNVSPTILNNIFANLTTGVNVDPTSPSTVLEGSVYQNDANNLSGTVANGSDLLSYSLSSSDPLFTNAANNDFYLAQGSKAIDSAINQLNPRSDLATAESLTGIAPSPTVAPAYDLYGQLRTADPQVNPGGVGSTLFKSRGAIESIDFTGPTVKLVNPIDNGSADQDPTPNVVHLVGGALANFQIQLNDVGTGVNDSTVVGSEFDLYRNGVKLTQGIDYYFDYDTNTKIVTLQPVTGSWPTGNDYTIYVDNGVKFDPNSTATPVGVADVAGNLLQANSTTGYTQFQILLQNGTGDAPTIGVPSLQSVNENGNTPTSLAFSTASTPPNPISIFNIDAPSDQVTAVFTPANGTLSIANLSIANLKGSQTVAFTRSDGTQGTVTVTFSTTSAALTLQGTAADINMLLNGIASASPPLSPLTFTPTVDYRGNNAGINISVTDPNLNNGNGLTGTNAVAIDVLPVNQKPVVNVVPPAGYSVSENPATALVITGVSISDVDYDPTFNGGIEQVTINVPNGIVTLSQTTGLTFIQGSGIGNSMEFTGTLTAINNALNGMQFLPANNFAGPTDINFSIDDLGNSPPPEAIGTGQVPINVTPVNQPPFANPIPPVVVNETSQTGVTTTINLSQYIGDPDENNTPPEAPPLLAVVGNSNPTLLSATINGQILTITYFPYERGNATITIRATDSNVGPTHPSIETTVTVTVNPVNFPPVTSTSLFIYTPGVPLVVTAPGVLAADVDHDNNPLKAVLTQVPQHGQLFLNADGSFTYNPDPGFNGHDSFTYVADDGLGNRVPATVYLDSPTTAPFDRYVTAVYEDVLGRAPDPDGLAYWIQQLVDGVPISSVAQSIGHSDEYYQKMVIEPAFMQLLGRPADASGLAYWTAEMDGTIANVTDQQLEADLVSAGGTSGEFYTKAGGTNTDWIDAVYRLLLGRPADAAGEAFWNEQLLAGQTLNQVAQGIAGSKENNTQLINADYFHYLGRAADPAGLAYWLQQFADGSTNEDVIAGFTGSAEYYKEKTGVNP